MRTGWHISVLSYNHLQHDNGHYWTTHGRVKPCLAPQINDRDLWSEPMPSRISYHRYTHIYIRHIAMRDPAHFVGHTAGISRARTQQYGLLLLNGVILKHAQSRCYQRCLAWTPKAPGTHVQALRPSHRYMSHTPPRANLHGSRYTQSNVIATDTKSWYIETHWLRMQCLFWTFTYTFYECARSKGRVL